MATLVFSAIGTALGGPIGAAIGALAGQAIDRQIFKPAGRTGPRLADLNVQTSRYGASVPRIFGRMRVAGTVIWATDLKESRSTSGGGKGQPSLTSYSYAASLAVALSSRPILGVGRIWADGNLLRGAAGDFKSPVGALRIHDGSAGQAADPLIAAAEGMSETPAFRSLAYIVLEDLQLADFGNRIPSLTVEVIADGDDVPVSGIAADLLGGPVGFVGEDEPQLGGFAADGGDAGEAMTPLVDGFGLVVRGAAGNVALVERDEGGRVIAKADALAWVDGREEPAGDLSRLAVESVPRRLSVRHFDAARDYQLGVQSADRAGPGRGAAELALPAVIPADMARGLAERALRARLAGRRTLAGSYGWPLLESAAGECVTVEGQGGLWRVEQLEWSDMAVHLTLRALASGTALSGAAGDSGRPLLPPDLVQGATHLAAVELGAPEDRLADAPLVFAAATGATAGWRRAALFRYHGEIEAAEPAGATAGRAVLGTALSALPPGQPWMFDRTSTVDVALDFPGNALLDSGEDALVRGANLCALGAELLQFGRAQALGGGQYRLSQLVRGVRGTEWAMAGHGSGERFVLLDPARLAPIAMAPSDIGRLLSLRASGPGDDVPAEAELSVDGRAVLPPAPVHPRVREVAGDLKLVWTRRSRNGWRWLDLTDVPLGEEREAYRVTLVADGAILRETEAAVPEWLYAAADRAADLASAGGAPLGVEVRQLGTLGPGRPLAVDLSAY